MSNPSRRFPPGTSYLVTRLYPRGRALRRPGVEVNRALCACIDEAADDHGVEVHDLKPFPGYCQFIATDHCGRFPEFLKRLAEHVGRLEPVPGDGAALWARGAYSLVRIPRRVGGA